MHDSEVSGWRNSDDQGKDPISLPIVLPLLIGYITWLVVFDFVGDIIYVAAQLLSNNKNSAIELTLCEIHCS
ncbi:15022_t:CDS:2 [Dentiscutata erythropus]|uniref:15022_t:CDS:1 n=1 Tax=Dentiscutata erythropus TaxID=1348616 RepID=A0A9N9NPS6_9GLOM|nr:15022_t:CDS:2 [Dentiscutata erythropus]